MLINNTEHLLINTEETLKKGISKIESGQLKIAFVVNKNKEVLGILSDGDVRRALLRDISLEDRVCKAMNKDFISAKKGISNEEIYELMNKHSIQHIPIIGSDKRIVELFVHNSFVSQEKINFKNPVVIMAGGKGKRLRPLTRTCPKPMLKVNGKPMLEILIEKLIKSGFRNFYISVNYLKEQIIDYFQDGKSLGINIKYLIEEKPLGTAGSLSLLPKTIKEPFLVMNADVLTKFDINYLLNFHYKNNAKATLSVLQSEFQIPFGVVKTEGNKLIDFEEKPTHRHIINAGIYIISPEILPIIEKDEFIDMPNLMMKALKSGYKTIVCPIHEYWIDIGVPDKLNQVVSDLKSETI